MSASLREAVYGSNGCLAAVLASGEPTVLHVNGCCMEPVIRNQDSVCIESARWVLPGDVVAVRSGVEGSEILMHRFLGYVWRRGGWRLMTMADSAARPDALADFTQLLGKVIARENRPYHVAPYPRARALGAWILWTLRLAFRN